MKIDHEAVKALRLKRAWSQEQLAAASGLSLRTIQRIEKSGIAANESVQALAAVFDVRVDALLPSAPKWAERFPRRSIKIGAAFSGGALAGFILASANIASALDLTVQSFVNKQPLETKKLEWKAPITLSLKDASARERARVQLEVSELKDDRIRLDLVLYSCQDGECSVDSRPAMITHVGVPAKVEWRMKDGDVASYEITPSR